MIARNGWLATIGLALATLTATPASADDFGFSFGYRGSDYYRPVYRDCYRPATVVYTRPSVYYTEPYYYAPRTVVVAPAPRVIVRDSYYARPVYRSAPRVSASFYYRDNDGPRRCSPRGGRAYYRY